MEVGILINLETYRYWKEKKKERIDKKKKFKRRKVNLVYDLQIWSMIEQLLRNFIIGSTSRRR